MHVYDARRLRLRELLLETSAAEMARRLEVDPSVVSRWKSAPGAPGHKNMSESSARLIERKFKKPTNWMDNPPPEHGSEARDSHAMRPGAMTIAPEHLAWEVLAVGEDNDEWPDEFQTELPDNSMAPGAPKGTVVIFVRAPAEPGNWVLVRDKTGTLYFREYRVQAPGLAWIAHATNAAFLPLYSDRDGLRIVARLDGMRGLRSL